MSNIREIKTTITKYAGLCTAHKIVNQVKTHPRNTKNQAIIPKKGEVGTSSSRAKVNIGILRGQQRLKTTAQKAGTCKFTSEINISDVRKDTGLNGAGAKWYLRYPKEGLKPEEGSGYTSVSLSAPRKRVATAISPHEGNDTKKSKS